MFSAYPDVGGVKFMTHHKCFTNTISLNPQNNHKEQWLCLCSPFYKEESECQI